MEFQISHRTRRQGPFSEEDKKIAQQFANKVQEELQDFAMSIVLFGSASKEKRSNKGDIDVLIIVDDANIIINKQVSETYKVLITNIAANISLKLHISTLKLTNYWEHVKNGDPVIVNILRDGIPLIDKGLFKATQILLDQGRIRPTKESVWTYYVRAPLSVRNAKKNVMQACVDLYWAGIDASHAALMAQGALPPSPEHVPDLMDEYLVNKNLLHKKHAALMRKLYTLNKQIEHREVREISGKEFDKLLLETENMLEALRRIVKQSE